MRKLRRKMKSVLHCWAARGHVRINETQAGVALRGWVHFHEFPQDEAGKVKASAMAVKVGEAIREGTVTIEHLEASPHWAIDPRVRKPRNGRHYDGAWVHGGNPRLRRRYS